MTATELPRRVPFTVEELCRQRDELLKMLRRCRAARLARSPQPRDIDELLEQYKGIEI